MNITAEAKALESYRDKLADLADKEPTDWVHYFDEPFEPNTCEDYCGKCAHWVVELMRCKLVMDCLAFLDYPILAQRCYQSYKKWWDVKFWGEWKQKKGWWYFYSYRKNLGYIGLESYVHPHQERWCESDGMRCCYECGITLEYVLTDSGMTDEISHFDEQIDNELDSRTAYQLLQIFDGAGDCPEFEADLLRLSERFLV